MAFDSSGKWGKELSGEQEQAVKDLVNQLLSLYGACFEVREVWGIGATVYLEVIQIEDSDDKFDSLLQEIANSLSFLFQLSMKVTVNKRVRHFSPPEDYME